MGTIPLTPGGALAKLVFKAVEDSAKNRLTPRQYMLLKTVGDASVTLSDAAVIDLGMSVALGHPLTRAQQAHAIQVARGWSKFLGARSKPMPTSPSASRIVASHPGTRGISVGTVARTAIRYVPIVAAFAFFATLEQPGTQSGPGYS